MTATGPPLSTFCLVLSGWVSATTLAWFSSRFQRRTAPARRRPTPRTPFPTARVTVLSAVVQPAGRIGCVCQRHVDHDRRRRRSLHCSSEWGSDDWLCIGTSQDDQSATLNGDIGDVMMWKVALPDGDGSDGSGRIALENALMAKFHCGASYPTHTITASTTGGGGTITPAGTTTVQYEADLKYTIASSYGYTCDVVLDAERSRPISATCPAIRLMM